MPRLAVASLAAGGVLYALFQAAAVTDISPGGDAWQLGVLMHALIILLVLVGLVGIGLAWRLEGWVAAMWWSATALAGLGLVAAHVFWALGLFGIAIVLGARFRALGAATLTAIGGGGWLAIYLLGARVGNEDVAPPTAPEAAIALVALACMGAGLAAGAWAVRREPPTVQPAGA